LSGQIDAGAEALGFFFIAIGVLVFFRARAIGPNMAGMTKSRFFHWQRRVLLSRGHPITMRFMGIGFVASGIVLVVGGLRWL
jgi:hypothetical protein